MRYKGIKDKVWTLVKKYNRLREKDCYTCGAKDIEGYNAQSGHYKPTAIVGSNNRRNWDPRFIHLQCGRCNGPGQGEEVLYRTHLIKDYGEDIVKGFEQGVRSKSYDAVKDWNAFILTYQQLIKDAS